MNFIKNSNSAIIMSKILAIFLSILGYFTVFVFGITLLFGKFPDAATIIIVIIFFLLGIVLIIHGHKIRKRIKRFKQYVNIISVQNQSSVPNIASICSRSVDFVAKDLQFMINRKYFTNAYIDKTTNEFVLKNKYYEFTQIIEKTDTDFVPIIEKAFADFVPKNNNNEMVKSAEKPEKVEKPDSTPKLKTVICKNCGASNEIPTGTNAECQYCGSVLHD